MNLIKKCARKHSHGNRLGVEIRVELEAVRAATSARAPTAARALACLEPGAALARPSDGVWGHRSSAAREQRTGRRDQST